MLLAALFVATAMAGIVPAAHAAAAATSASVSVSATRGWQQAGISLKKGQTYSVSYVSGTWTVDKRNFASVDAAGYSNSVDQQIYQPCKYDAQRNYAVLLGRLGSSGAAFPIGDGGTFTAASSGVLYFRINDDDACLGDNAGAVTMYASLVSTIANPNYAGYSIHAAANGVFTIVEATWVVPQISLLQCANILDGKFKDPRAAVWAGLWGAKWLPQIGTISQCNLGPRGPNLGRNYYAFWQMYTTVSGGGAQGYGAKPQPITSMTVMPGDKMFGSVEYEGKSDSDLEFSLVLYDETRETPASPDGFSINVTTTKPVAYGDIMAQGGAVVEPDCQYGLASFGSVPFTQVQVGSVPMNGVPQAVRFALNKWTLTGSNGSPLAVTGPVSGFPSLMNYTVTYKASGPVSASSCG